MYTIRHKTFVLNNLFHTASLIFNDETAPSTYSTIHTLPLLWVGN